MTGLFDSIRSGAQRVAQAATSVQIDPERLETFALEVGREGSDPIQPDPAHHRFAGEIETLAYIVTLDAINFGSGWFPLMHKRQGCSGYFTVATALKERFESDGAFSATELRDLDTDDCCALFGQDVTNVEIFELMAKFATSLNDLGQFLEAGYGGKFEVWAEAGAHSAERLAMSLTEMPFFRDVSRYVPEADDDAFDVPLYKRAQLTCADLATAFGGKRFGRLDDLDRLTIFADNLVPHVLRCEGVLVYREDLAESIDTGQRIEAGSREEIEIRAVCLHAVEGMVDVLREAGSVGATAQRLDYLLWNRGQAPAIKARPRHRARSVFY